MQAEEKQPESFRLLSQLGNFGNSELSKLPSLTGIDNKVHRNKRIWDAWLACETYDEIGERENLERPSVIAIVENSRKSDAVKKSTIFANYQNADWKPPIYNVWKQQTSKQARIN